MTLLAALAAIEDTPLDQIQPLDVCEVVEEIRRRDADEKAVDVARFGSSI